MVEFSEVSIVRFSFKPVDTSILETLSNLSFPVAFNTEIFSVLGSVGYEKVIVSKLKSYLDL